MFRIKPRYLLAYARQLATLGIDPWSILDPLGISDAVRGLEPLDGEMLIEALDALGNAFADGTALSMGLQGELIDLGLIGYRLLLCEDLNEVLEVWNRYSPVADDPFASSVIFDGPGWLYSEAPWIGLSEPALQFCTEASCSALATLFRKLLADPYPRMSLELPYAAPKHHSRYLQLGFAEVSFGARRMSIRGNNGRHPLRASLPDPDAKLLCEMQCDMLLANRLRTVSVSFRTQNLLMLTEPIPNAAKAAELLGLSRRTLLRRLREEGQSYQSLLDGARWARYSSLTRSGALGRKELAWSLGFSDVSGFARLLQRRLSTAPAQLGK